MQTVYQFLPYKPRVYILVLFMPKMPAILIYRAQILKVVIRTIMAVIIRIYIYHQIIKQTLIALVMDVIIYIFLQMMDWRMSPYH